MVWVNAESHIYHREGSRWYGRTKKGKYMTEADAIKEGDRADKEGSKTKPRSVFSVDSATGDEAFCLLLTRQDRQNLRPHWSCPQVR